MNKQIDQEEVESIPEEIDIQRIEEQISEDIKKSKKKEKSRQQKEKKKLKQFQLECSLEKILQYIVTKKLSVKTNREHLVGIVKDFVGKQAKFFQILDHVLKRHLDKAIEAFWNNTQDNQEMFDKQTYFTKYVDYHKGLMLRFYQELVKLGQSNVEIVKFLQILFETSTDKEREKKYSAEGLIMSEYIYILQEDHQIREVVRIWKSLVKSEMDLGLNQVEKRLLNNFDFDRYYEAFQMLESEPKNDHQSKAKKRKKNKNRQASETAGDQLIQQGEVQQLNQDQISYQEVLSIINKIGEIPCIRIELSSQGMNAYR